MLIFFVNDLKGTCPQEEGRGREENGKRERKGLDDFLYDFSFM